MFLAIIGGVFIVWLILALLFSPHIPYHIEADLDAAGDHYVNVLESTCLAKLEPGNTVEVLTNGDVFYPAMLEAIRSAVEATGRRKLIIAALITGLAILVAFALQVTLAAH